jgi:adenine-specific DNA-methyltransferase
MAQVKTRTSKNSLTANRDLDSYTHDDKHRLNNPPVGMAQFDKDLETRKTYEFDPHLDPTLEWAGKKENRSFNVLTSSIHIHEIIKPNQIIGTLKAFSDAENPQLPSLFATSVEYLRLRKEALQFYQHDVNWKNRLIAGDSLIIMNSLLEKEGLSGQVQTIYFDPPYGIKYGSNFQPFVNKRNVTDGKDEDLTQDPEMITAFRDTWELGIHSYLTYLRNRLLLARELLSESGSVFVQISDENVHLIRCICDEIFGVDNFISLISFSKTTGFASKTLSSIADYIVWYSKDKKKIKYHQLFKNKVAGDEGATKYKPLKSFSAVTNDIKIKFGPEKLATLDQITSQDAVSGSKESDILIIKGIKFKPPVGMHWKTTITGLNRLLENSRLVVAGNMPRFVRLLDDFPVFPIVNIWSDIGGIQNRDEGKLYVVQTATSAIARCLLMTTDPSDLVLDITCGSGTTAFVAEQWGRRWITCDTSRIAIALAKKRLMTATFDYYNLAHKEEGISGGFIYKTVPHVTLKSIANNEPPERETLYDQPDIDKSKFRVSGPFTVEALPAPVGVIDAVPLDEVPGAKSDYSAKQADWRSELLATGILGRRGAKILFSRVEPLSGTTWLHAEAETKEAEPRRAVICFAGETKPLDARAVSLALDEAEALRPAPKLIIFAAFQFDPEAAKDIDDTIWHDITLLKVQMNTDLMTDDLKKKRSSNQSFWLVGQPDVELIKIKDGKNKGKFKVSVKGFDYYDVKKGSVEGGGIERIAMWMLDTNYDGMLLNPVQVFFPLDGKAGGWSKLEKILKTNINQDLLEAYVGTVSLPFELANDTMIAVKIVDDRGIESLRVLKAGGI